MANTDFTFCSNTDCPKKEFCKRTTTESDKPNQSYQKFSFKKKGTHVLCDMYVYNGKLIYNPT